jgi:hypothetical protein
VRLNLQQQSVGSIHIRWSETSKSQVISMHDLGWQGSKL